MAKDTVNDLTTWLDTHFPSHDQKQVWNKQLRNPAGLSQQDNGVDCGPLVFAYMKEIHQSRKITFPKGNLDTRAIREEVFSLLLPQPPASSERAGSITIDVLRENFPTINLAEEDVGKLLNLFKGGTPFDTLPATQ